MAASLKISELNAMTAVADDDLFLITDTSATTSKKLAFSTLKSSIGAAAHTVMGVAFGTAHLGTFSGTTISDSQTVKQALQALETAAELRATSASPTLTGTISLAGEGRIQGLDDNLELDITGTTGVLKIGTKLVSSHQMEIGTVGFQTMLKGVVAINHANSELKIQNSNRIYVENTPVVLDGGGVVTIADNNAAALDIKEGSNSLLKIITTNGSELTELGTALTISGLTTLDGGGTLGVDGSDAANFELNKTGTSGLIKLGTRMVSSQKQVIGTPSFDTTLKGTIAMSGTTSEYKIQTANRVYIENTPIVLDNGGVVTISDNNAAALDIKEGSNSLLKIVTTNGSESVAVGTNLSVAGALVLDSAIIANVQTSGESFADNDTSVMTSKAIDDRIAVTAATAVTQAGLHIDDIHSALGIASEAVNFGTFTGSTIGDNLTLKAVAQALETATELRAPIAAPTFTGTATFAGGGELEASGSDFAINKSGSSGLIKIGTGMTGSQKQEIGTVNIDTTLKGVIAMSGATSEYKIQSANRVYLEATPIVFDNGGTVTVSDNLAAALDIKEGSNSLLKIVTTNGSEAVAVGTNLTVAGNLTVQGTQTVVDTVTMTAANAIVFEGASADDHESTLTIVDPTADRTIKLPDQSGCLPVLAADSTTAITSTPEELNLLDGITAGTVSASLAVIADSNKDVTGFRNVTLTGELDAATLDISGDADIDGTTNLDAVDIDGNVQADGTVTVGTGSSASSTDYSEVALTSLSPSSFNQTYTRQSTGFVLDTGTVASTNALFHADSNYYYYVASTGPANTGRALIFSVEDNKWVTIFDMSTNLTEGNVSNNQAVGSVFTDDVIATAQTQDGRNVPAASSDVTFASSGGSSGTGYDVKFFGDANSTQLLWDASADDLILSGSAGLIVPDGQFTLGSTAVTSTAAELNVTDGVTAGTVIASKALVADANIDITGGRNITITGELDAATLDISGNADIDGTTNLDVVDIDGATQIDATVTVGVDDTGYDVKFFGATSGASLLWDESADDLILAGAAGLVVPDGQLTLGSTAVTSTAAELNLVDGITAGTVSASLAVIVDSNKDITGFRNITATGDVTIPDGDLILGSTAVTSTAAELNLVDGITAGTVSASLAVIVDSNKDVTGFRNVTATGEVDCATLDVSSTSAFADNVVIENGKEIRLSEASGNGTNYTGFKAPAALSANVSFTLPDGDGTNGQVITTNGSAVLAWSDAPDPTQFGSVTAGTVAASKGVLVDSNKDITGFRNVTLTGELDAATGDFSGDVDIDGTANLDAVDIDGVVQIDGATTFGVDDTGVDVKFFGATSGAYMLWDESEDDLVLAGAAGLDIAGNIDVDGTSNLDAVDIDGDVDLAGDLTFSAAKDIHFPDNEAAALEFAQAGNAYLTFVSTNSSEAVKISKNLDIDADDIDVSTQVTDIKIIDNQALALRIMEGSTEYLRVTTTNSGEKIDVSTSLQLDGAVDINGAVDCSGDVTFSDAQSISMADNLGFALRVMEGSNEYVRFVTTDGSEEVDFSKSVKFDGGMTLGGGINVPASQDITLVASNSNALDFVIASGNRMMRFNTNTETVLMEQNIDVDGTANLDAVDIDGDVDLAGDLTFSAAKDIQIVDNSGVALEIAEAGNNYMTFVTTNDSEAIKIEKTLDLDANLNVATQATDILMKDNQAAALDIMEGSNSYLKFDTTNSSELITATKALNVAGGLQIGGTAVTATAAELNLLDDSAQTTWTAQLEGSTGNPGSKITATGEYVRMGKIIIASVHFNSVDTSSYAGDISISGLPVGSKNTSTAMFMGTVYNSGMISGATDSVQALVADNGTTISFTENDNNSALAWGTVGAGKSMRVQVVYISA